MINEDILIKFSRQNPDIFPNLDWVESSIAIRDWIRFIRDWDFKGLGTDDMDLIRDDKVKEGTRIILPGNKDEASILGLVLRRQGDAIELEIEALGCGTDYKRDPDRLLRYGTKIYPLITDYRFILELTSKPRVSAGSTYYFFSKSVRDNRLNIDPRSPENSRRMILGSLKSNLYNNDERIRAQYLHYIRRIEEESKKVINALRLPEDDILSKIYRALPDINKVKDLL